MPGSFHSANGRGEKKSTSCNRRETRVKPYSVCGRVVVRGSGGGGVFGFTSGICLKGREKGQSNDK